MKEKTSNGVVKDPIKNVWNIDYENNNPYSNLEVFTKRGYVILNRDGFNIIKNTSEVEFKTVCEKILSLLDE